MRRLVTCSIAFLAVLAVFTVLVTPAFDELPSTAPHSAQSFGPPITMMLASIAVVVVGQLPKRIGRLIAGTNLLLLTCTRLC